MIILDAMEKTSGIYVLQAELNDRPGVMLKVTGPLADVQAAIDAARSTAEQMQADIIADLIPSADALGEPAYLAPVDYNPLIEQATVQTPDRAIMAKEITVNDPTNFAVGFIETQGFTAVFEAIDTAVKTAAVEVLAREKLGGGYITVVIKGDVAAVRAAIDAGKGKVEGLGRLIAAHVIPNPSKSVLALLPKQP
jgi:carbon dioxide concentrating mechanism protein CcmO